MVGSLHMLQASTAAAVSSRTSAAGSAPDALIRLAGFAKCAYV